MMKNIYALGGLGVSKDNFVLNILYQQPAGSEIRYLPEGQKKGIPLLTLLNLDRLDAQNNPNPDGVFDFVEGTTINTQQGKIIFPVLEPFGADLASAVGLTADSLLYRKYIYQVLYDSTKTLAQQFQQVDRYILRGTYKSTSSSDIFLGGFNIPPGSVSVSAGGTKLVENQDYTMDYGLGKIKIINTGILNSGVPINIQYEDNAAFGFQQQNFMGARFDYYLNKNLTLGGTFMRLKERPFTQQVSYGDDPIQNTVLGMDANYQTEVPALTRALDKLPIYSTTSPSFLNSNLEVATLLPGHPKQIAALDPEGAIYIDNFEGTSSTYDLKFPSVSWSLASTPFGAVNSNNQVILPEAALHDALKVGSNRARLAWYNIEPSLVDGGSGGGSPGYVSKDSNQHYIRIVQQKDIFPYKSLLPLQSIVSTFDLGYYPKDRGPYNFDGTNVNSDGTLKDPASRWAGITRPLDNTDFESSNVEYIQFWVLDPFINRPNSNGGSLYFNLGNVSEDVLKDSRMFFENGIPAPFDRTKLDTTVWGFVPKFAQQITRSFDNDGAARELQDVGYDGLPDSATQPQQLDERTQFSGFLNELRQTLGAGNPAYLEVYNDPASDNYHFYRGSDYDKMNNGDGLGVLGRYKKYNNPQGNSPITSPTASFATSSTTIPESEDINRDNTLNESETYFQYRIDFRPNMQVGSNYIINKQVSNVKLPNGKLESETWYQFKIPVKNYDHKIGGIADFRSIRFIRMFLHGWDDSVIMRFGTLELGRNQWRSYGYSLETPGENLPQQNQGLTDFTVSSVSIEENGKRDPVPYMIPPGVNRQMTTVAQNQVAFLNEQSLSLKVCALQDGDARAVYKEVNVDMRQYNNLRMFVHAESMIGQAPVRDADVEVFVRIGSDFTNNYYEYRMPLAITTPMPGITETQVWPSANMMNVILQELVNAKKARDAANLSNTQPYQTKDSKGNVIVVLGNPNVGGAKNFMLGLRNPKKTNQTPGDDGMPKCLEVWFDEMRMAGIKDNAGYAAAGKVSVQLADLGNFNLSGSMHTPGYGNIDQKIGERMQDNYYQYNASTNLNLGKVMPRNWGVQMPAFVGYTQSVSTPKYDPYNQDVLLADQISNARNSHARDSIRKISQDFVSIKSFNFTNVRITGNPSAAPKARMPWSVKNFDFTYSYNDQVKRSPTIEKDQTKTQKLGVGYAYSIKTKPFEPFKRIIRSKSKWVTPIRDFNITPLPSTFTVRNDLNRINEMIQVRNINNDGSQYRIPPTFYKNFTWNRLYTLRWEIMRSISLDYTATNISRIDEPYGYINTGRKRDSLWGRIATFGHNTSYNQSFNSTYNVPLSKLPLTDWVSVRLGYNATYNWTAAPPIAYELGNTIGNTQTKTVAGELNMSTLYNKWKWLRAINGKAKVKTDNKEKDSKPGANNSSQIPAEKRSTVKDLRRPGSTSNTQTEQPPQPGEGPAAGNDKGSKDKGGADKGGPTDRTTKADKDNPNKPDEPKPDNSKAEPPKAPSITGNDKYDSVLQRMNTAKMTDEQIDSVVKVLKAQDKAKAAAEKAKKKKSARLHARQDAQKCLSSHLPSRR